MFNVLVEGLGMHKKLLIPGPTEVSQEILNEQAHLLIGHRGAEFAELYGGITAKLTKYFELTSDVQPDCHHFFRNTLVRHSRQKHS